MDYMNTNKKVMEKRVIALVAAVGVFLLGTWIFQMSWNASVPKMFNGAKQIKYMTAILFLIAIWIAIPSTTVMASAQPQSGRFVNLQ